MTFWDFAHEHPVSAGLYFVFCALFITVWVGVISNAIKERDGVRPSRKNLQ